MYKNHYVCKVNHFFVTNKEKAKKAKKKKAKSLTFCPCTIFVIVINTFPNVLAKVRIYF